MIGIVDYGLGNVKAFANIYHSFNVPFVIVKEPGALSGVTRIVLPGVGAFDQAMARLEASGLRQPLGALVLEKRMPVIGVCVGMQILMDSSEEGTRPGLGWISGDVVRFAADADVRVPHMGWNVVTPAGADKLFDGIGADSRYYFLHSYYVRAADPAHVLAHTNYAGSFACAVRRDNIIGVQFHPEKSHRSGTQLLRNFAVQ
jgi:imidazole glycerol-phosphate synthase subunit HisH